MSSDAPDYYTILNISPTATHDEIRKAYKIQALKTHPDRVPADSPERPARTKKFQQVNDAFYVLSDSKRRAEYDSTRSYKTPPKPGWQDAQFGDIFEEMMGDASQAEQQQQQQQAQPQSSTGRFYGMIGGLSGACLGFIVANFPGAMAGAVAGNRLGAIRDSKGKSVYEVFQTLPQGEKGRMLTELLTKLLATAVSG